MTWMDQKAGAMSKVAAVVALVGLVFLSLLLIFGSGVAAAGEPLKRPAVPALVSGECLKNIPLRRGEDIPPMIIARSGLSSCSAVIVPLSQYADLLATEKWGEAVSQQYRVDVAALEMERDWYKKKLEREMEPLPFLERPATQRWFGRLETLVTVGVVAVGLSAAYSYGAGGFK